MRDGKRTRSGTEYSHAGSDSEKGNFRPQNRGKRAIFAAKISGRIRKSFIFYEICCGVGERYPIRFPKRCELRRPLPPFVTADGKSDKTAKVIPTNRNRTHAR